MNIIKCESGHFFDCETYEKCPHCRHDGQMQNNIVNKEKIGTPPEERKGLFKRKEKNRNETPEADFGFGNQNYINNVNRKFECEPTELLYTPKVYKCNAGNTLPFDENECIEEYDGLKDNFDSVISDTSVYAEDIPEKSDLNCVTTTENMIDGELSDCKNNILPDQTELSAVENPDYDCEINSTVDISVNENLRETVNNNSCGSNPNEPTVINETKDEKTISDEFFDPVVGWIVGISGKNIGKSYCIYAGRNSVGNSKSNTVALEERGEYPFSVLFYIIFNPSSGLYFLQPGQSREVVKYNGTELIEAVPVSEDGVISTAKGEYRLIPLCGRLVDFYSYGILKK